MKAGLNWKVGIGLALVVVLGALGAIYYVAGTPQYTLYRLRKAVLEKDRATVFRLVDFDKVVAHGVERMLSKPAPAGPNVFSKQGTDVVIPATSELVREKLADELEDPATIALLDAKVDSVAYQNLAALITLRDPKDDSTTTVTLERRPDRGWRVVDVDLRKLDIAFTMDEIMRKADELHGPNMPEITKPDLSDVPGAAALPNTR
jgi:hypothetical protein